MTTFPTLLTSPLPHFAMDYARLRAEGIRLLERLAGEQWTDFNAHDPGITILEQLCYAITDLAYRTNYPMADLLAANTELGLHGPEEILTTDPVTRADLRKVALDDEGIDNVWVEPVSEPEPPFYFHPSSHQIRLQADASRLETNPVHLQGLYRVLLQTLSEQLLNQADIERLYKHRLLGEDFICAKMEGFNIRINASIEVDTVENPVAVLADIIERIENYLAPPVRFIAPSDAPAKEKRIDELFQGPRLSRGFVAQLPERRHTVYRSDLLHAIMDVEQVRAVRSLESSSPVQNSQEGWALTIPNGKIARLASDSSFTLLRAGFEMSVDSAAARTPVAQRRSLRVIQMTDGLSQRTPAGRDRSLARYRSIQRQLPAAYGIGLFGLPDSATASRQAQALQLKAYLLIFDQLLANAFAQLARAADLLSPNSEIQSYFAQPVDDPPLSLNELVSFNGESKNQWQQWLDDEIRVGDSPERRKRFLSHLLARFAEHLGDGLLTNPDTGRDQEIIAKREFFLSNYPRLSSARGSGYDILCDGILDDDIPSYDPTLLSGTEERIRLKLGLPDEIRFYLVERILLRPVAEDISQDCEEGIPQIPLLDAVDAPDPWSLQVSYVFEDSADVTDDFVRRVSQTIIAETPAHLVSYLHWLDSDEENQWGAFQSAWEDFRTHYRAYRKAMIENLIQNVPIDTLDQLRARDARDRLIDLLGFGRTYPLRDLPFPERLFVVSGDTVAIKLDFSQSDVDYELRYADTGEVVPGSEQVAGTGGPIDLITPSIDQDVSYRILAVKREGADDPTLPRETFLRGVVRIEEGIDTGVEAELLLPCLDPSIDNPKPTDARICDYGAEVEVEMLSSQEGVSYEIVNNNGTAAPVSQEPVVGTSGRIVLKLKPAYEDVDLRVRGQKQFGNPPQTYSALLDIVLLLRVRADRGISSTLDPAIIPHGGSSLLRLIKTETGISYQAWQRSVRDIEFIFEDPPDVITIDVAADNGRIVRLTRPPKAPVWQDIVGFAPLSDAVTGNGGDIEAPLNAFERDTLFLIQAIKEHCPTLLGSSSDTISSAVQLDQALALLVRPNHKQAIQLQVTIANHATNGPIILSNGQPGVYYELHPEGLEPIDRPAYFHQRDDRNTIYNKGIGVEGLCIQVDFAIARSRPSNQSLDPATTPPLDPALDSAAIPVGSVFRFLARKAFNGLETELDGTATIDEVPTIRVEPATVTPGQSANVVIETTTVGVRYTLLQADKVIGGPLAGTGREISFDTGPLSPNPILTVEIDRRSATISVRRRVELRIRVGW